MSHVLPSNLTRIDEVSETLLFMYENWLRDGGFDHEANRHSSSLSEAQRRALFRVTNQWLTDLAKRGLNLVVATQHCCRYSEGAYRWAEDKPWHIVNVSLASELFEFARDYNYDDGCFDYCYDQLSCFVTK